MKVKKTAISIGRRIVKSHVLPPPFQGTPHRPVIASMILSLLLTGWSVPAQADQLAYPNKYGNMAESMLDMMDAFSSAYQKRTGRQQNSSQPWMPGSEPNPTQYFNNPGWSLYSMPGGFGSPSWVPGMGNMMTPAMPMMQSNPWSSASNWMNTNPWSNAVPQPGYSTSPGWGSGPWSPGMQPSPLDGSWQGNSGEILTISQGRFRIYMNRNEYREGSISISGNYLTMTPVSTGHGRVYEFAEHQGRLALRDESGNLLLYQRIQR